MAAGFEEVMDNLYRSQRFFRAHLNGILAEQWDWKPFPSCRSIREILLHWAEIFAADDAALETGLKAAVPDVASVQALMKEAGLRFGRGFSAPYVDSAMETRLPNGAAVGTVLASLAGEDNYHAGQIAFIRLATEPAWDWVQAVHQTPSV
jgi:hypothetical protein